MASDGSVNELDLAALLCSRVIHDVIGPVGAIINGLELLEDETDEEMRSFAGDLIDKSARQASAKLKFVRLAFGAAGSAGAEINLHDAEDVARGFAAGEKMEVTWNGPVATMGKNRVKLLLNLFLIARLALPSGGSVDVSITGDVSAPRFDIKCSGKGARVPPGVLDLIAGGEGNQPASAHSIQPCYTGLIARACAMAVTIAESDSDVLIAAKSAV